MTTNQVVQLLTNSSGGLSIQTWLGLSVVGAFVTVIGSFIGVLLKDFLLARSFEKWKSRIQTENVYKRYRDPLVLTATELLTRLNEICEQYPPAYLNSGVVKNMPERFEHNWASDAYFLKYKFISTVYRFCALFAWIELYRRDLVFLHSGDNAHSLALNRCIDTIRIDIADGQINQESSSWKDYLIFREELRAIGEALIESKDGKQVVIGYAGFCEILLRGSSDSRNRWINSATYFFLDFKKDKDFRLQRLHRTIVHLVDLIELLDSRQLQPKFEGWRDTYRSKLPAMGS